MRRADPLKPVNMWNKLFIFIYCSELYSIIRKKTLRLTRPWSAEWYETTWFAGDQNADKARVGIAGSVDVRMIDPRETVLVVVCWGRWLGDEPFVLILMSWGHRVVRLVKERSAVLVKCTLDKKVIRTRVINNEMFHQSSKNRIQTCSITHTLQLINAIFVRYYKKKSPANGHRWTLEGNQ